MASGGAGGGGYGYGYGYGYVSDIDDKPNIIIDEDKSELIEENVNNIYFHFSPSNRYESINEHGLLINQEPTLNRGDKSDGSDDIMTGKLHFFKYNENIVDNNYIFETFIREMENKGKGDVDMWMIIDKEKNIKKDLDLLLSYEYISSVNIPRENLVLITRNKYYGYYLLYVQHDLRPDELAYKINNLEKKYYEYKDYCEDDETCYYQLLYPNDDNSVPGMKRERRDSYESNKSKKGRLGDNKYYLKYLKYKRKYLMLKSKKID